MRENEREEAEDRIVLALMHGAGYGEAAAAGGISRATLSRWRNGNANFEARVSRARAAAPEAVLAKILKAEDWRAAAWYAEYVHGYSRSAAHTSGGDIEGWDRE